MHQSSQPFGTDLGQALGWLKTQVWQLTESLQFLKDVRSSQVLLGLYEQCFPKEFDQSRGMRLRSGHDTRVSKFFELIEEQWFPIINPMESGDEWSAGCIDFQRLAFNLYETEPEDLSPTELLVAGLYGEWTWDVVLQWLKVKVDAVPTPISRREVPWEEVERTFTGQSEPICYLVKSIEVMARDTGNVFLDSAWEGYIEERGWTLENLHYLRDEFVKTLEIQKQVKTLDDWIEEDPHRIATIVDLWNQSTGDQQLELDLTPQAPQVRIIQASELETVMREMREQNEVRYQHAINAR